MVLIRISGGQLIKVNMDPENHINTRREDWNKDL